jgi:cbb3-type cytochrome oxidase maturation protein
MESLYLLIPMSLVVVAVIVLLLYWAVKGGQFEDLEGPGHSILMDDDVSFNRVIDKSKSDTSVNQKD